jgi:hypothetical protein
MEFIDWLGYYLFTVTFMNLLTVIILLFDGKSLVKLVHINWSYPSPIIWGIMVLFLTYSLHWIKKISIYESYFFSLMGALGSGWLYEILYGFPYWIRSGFASWNWIKWNPNFKVFLFEYQIFSLPIVFYLITRDYSIKIDKIKFYVLSIGAVVWHLLGFYIAPIFHKFGQTIGNTGYYAWVLRIPVALMIGYLINGVEKYE